MDVIGNCCLHDFANADRITCQIDLKVEDPVKRRYFQYEQRDSFIRTRTVRTRETLLFPAILYLVSYARMLNHSPELIHLFLSLNFWT